MRLTGADRGPWKRPTARQAIGRAATRRCPRCGKGQLFRHWLKMLDACGNCQMRFERGDGYWLGSMALNFAVTEVFFVAALVVLLVATWPDVPWTTVLFSVVAVNIVVPLAFYPFSRTIWVAVERLASRAWD